MRPPAQAGTTVGDTGATSDGWPGRQIARLDAQRLAGPRVERHSLGVQSLQAKPDLLVPVARLRLVRLPAANQQPVPRAGQRHIQQPVVLARPRGCAGLAYRLHGPAAQILVRLPQRQVGAGAVIVRPAQPALVRWQPGGIRQNHQPRLQALGAVHGHYAHRVARRFRLALHLGRRQPQPVQEALQRGRMGGRMQQRGTQQLVDRLGGFGTQPGKQPRPPAERPQRFGQQRVGRRIIDPPQQGGQERRRRLPVRPLVGPIAQRLE